MNDCCDWYAVGLNNREREDLTSENMEKSIYISYCPECNSIFEYKNNSVVKIEGDKKFEYMHQYHDQIVAAKTKKK